MAGIRTDISELFADPSEVDIPVDRFLASTLPPKSNGHIAHFLEVEQRHSRGEYAGRDHAYLRQVVRSMRVAVERIREDEYNAAMYLHNAQDLLAQLQRLQHTSLSTYTNAQPWVEVKGTVSSPTGSDSYKAFGIVKKQLPLKRVLNPRPRNYERVQ